MKKIAVLIGLMMSFLVLTAQTPTSWNAQEFQQQLAQCVTHGTDTTICYATDGISISWQGAAFVQISSPNAAPQPPANTQFTCVNYNANTGSGVKASGCTFAP